MGLKQGVTLIVGGGFHGKSTLLEALQFGVYDKVVGDGRELVVTEASACKVRAEDGRAVSCREPRPASPRPAPLPSRGPRPPAPLPLPQPPHSCSSRRPRDVPVRPLALVVNVNGSLSPVTAAPPAPHPPLR